jgi:hypothetical protein
MNFGVTFHWLYEYFLFCNASQTFINVFLHINPIVSSLKFITALMGKIFDLNDIEIIKKNEFAYNNA